MYLLFTTKKWPFNIIQFVSEGSHGEKGPNTAIKQSHKTTAVKKTCEKNSLRRVKNSIKQKVKTQQSDGQTTFGEQVSKVSICIAAYYEHISKALRYGPCYLGDHTVLPAI